MNLTPLLSLPFKKLGRCPGHLLPLPTPSVLVVRVTQPTDPETLSHGSRHGRDCWGLCSSLTYLDTSPAIPSTKHSSTDISVERVASCPLIEVLLTAVGWSAQVKLASIWRENVDLAWLSERCCCGRNGIPTSWERQCWLVVKVAGSEPDCLRFGSQCCRFLVYFFTYTFGRTVCT